MDIGIVTGSAGLIGSETVRSFADRGFRIVGIDNDMRSRFFGPEASTDWNRRKLESEVEGYEHADVDIRDIDALRPIFQKYSSDIKVIVHAAAQPSHDWAAKDPLMDFTVNAVGTLNLLELTREFCPEAVFIFTSTNKVYGDTPNSLPLIETDSRWELAEDHPFYAGVDETMSIDRSMHSVFGASKVSADVMVQEYGRYFGLKTGSFRGGCLTGPAHSGTQLHGFLAYLMRCAVTGTPYTIFGYKGKQVRDNIHSHDLVEMFWHFFQNPRPGEVYNAGGSRHSNCSMIEAIDLCEEISGNTVNRSYSEEARAGDHIWWISDVGKFRSHYPDWEYRYSVRQILEEIHEGIRGREVAAGSH